MPDPFGTANYANYKFSVYCTYTAVDAKSSIDQLSVEFDELNKEMDAIKTAPFEISKNSIVIYPNPTAGSVTVSMEKSFKDKLVLTIFDLRGRLIKTVQIEPDKYNIEVNLQDKKNGIYLFMLRDLKNGMLINRSKIIKY